VIFNGPFYK